jgi:hypothetical protein
MLVGVASADAGLALHAADATGIAFERAVGLAIGAIAGEHLVEPMMMSS